MKNNELDKFYTNPIVADYIVNKLFNYLNLDNNYIFIEPSAGCGNFIVSLQKKMVNLSRIKAYDIQPKDHNFIKQQDYLTLKIVKDPKNIILGNPPFGYRGKLALQFLNKAAKESNVIAFILPMTFKRFSIQKQISSELKLIYQEILKPNSFLVNDKEYKVNTIFQIWINKKIPVWCSDKRLPSNSNGINMKNDFILYIHNNTKQTLKFFNKKKYGWEFAICRQGYYDYKTKIYNQSKLIKNRQYLFVKIISEEAKEIFDQIDFEKLSKQNSTTTPGFSNSDVIEEYLLLKAKKYFSIPNLVKNKSLKK